MAKSGFKSGRQANEEARERWHDVDLANAAFVPHHPQTPSRVLETLAAAAYLGVPDAFLAAMSPSTLCSSALLVSSSRRLW